MLGRKKSGTKARIFVIAAALLGLSFATGASASSSLRELGDFGQIGKAGFSLTLETC